MLRATFVRHLNGRDRVYVTRADGTTTGWDFPSYGGRLPHDLCHLIVEQELTIIDGFWGLVDDGAEVALLDNQATLMKGGQPLMQAPGADISGLLAAEKAVAAFTGSSPTLTGEGESNAGIEVSVAARLKERLDALQAEWARLEDGGSLTLDFTAR